MKSRYNPYFPKPPKTRREKLIIAAFNAAAVLLLLGAVYLILKVKCTAWNSATGDNLTVWEYLWLDTRYTGPK